MKQGGIHLEVSVGQKMIFQGKKRTISSYPIDIPLRASLDTEVRTHDIDAVPSIDTSEE